MSGGALLRPYFNYDRDNVLAITAQEARPTSVRAETQRQFHWRNSGCLALRNGARLMDGKQISAFIAIDLAARNSSDYTTIVMARREVLGGAARRCIDWLLRRPRIYGRLVVEGIYHFKDGVLIEGFDDKRAGKSIG